MARRFNFIFAGVFSLSLLIFCVDTFAWDHGFSAGFGYGPEHSRNYNNMGIMADGILRNINIDEKLNFLVGANGAYWHAGAGKHRNLYTTTLSLGFRAYFVNQAGCYRPFLQLAAGPSLLSQKTFGTKTQGSVFAFQDRLGAGLEVGAPNQSLIFLLEYVHYSNAGLFKPNPGFNIPFVFSVGYLF